MTPGENLLRVAKACQMCQCHLKVGQWLSRMGVGHVQDAKAFVS